MKSSRTSVHKNKPGRQPTAFRPPPSAFRLLPSAFCLLLFTFCFSAAAQARWTRQTSGTLAWLHAVYFLDQNRGWAVGSKGALLATVDGGKTWLAKPKPTDDVLRDIHFFDSQTGWLVCETNVYELRTNDQPRTYLMTTDDGEKWKRLPLPTRHLLLGGALFDNDRGWLVGAGATILQTSDGGETWHT